MKKNEDDPPLTIISSLPIRVFVTGDLANFAAILEKVNMAGNWCTLCGLSAKEWSPADHDKGELWTLEAMAAVRESISLGVLLYWSNPVSQVLRAMAFKRTTRGRSHFGELMTVKIS
jgi:hypothetical protein